MNRIYRGLCEKAVTVVEALVGMPFVATSMPLVIISDDDGSYEFDYGYMPISNR